ncbi:hypothetical protein FHS18_004895 [Paenibacillus phyllosphaerae]|uniref:Uncharacterized protein n=1 Tax=Paenibacillus phyllosphaerae TaxID=274593 RepID=A0A7W5B1T1_9BACL|nr:hypothetical protein [Paenibacillus phyllosphaerae]MBB3112793.1 hypothetical protein [Paenibacillus phyllosphaerae]
MRVPLAYITILAISLLFLMMADILNGETPREALLTLLRSFDVTTLLERVVVIFGCSLPLYMPLLARWSAKRKRQR